MKKVFKILGYILLGLLVIALLTGIFFFIKWNRNSAANMKLLGEAVEQQKEDVPYDSKNPLYPFGAGMHMQNFNQNSMELIGEIPTKNGLKK